jgi:hypothetical protein
MRFKLYFIEKRGIIITDQGSTGLPLPELPELKGTPP